MVSRSDALLYIAAETVLVPTLFEFFETHPTTIAWQYG